MVVAARCWRQQLGTPSDCVSPCAGGGHADVGRRPPAVYSPRPRRRRGRSLPRLPWSSRRVSPRRRRRCVARVRSARCCRQTDLDGYVVLPADLIRLKKVKVAHTRLPSVWFQSWSQFLAVSLQVTWVINPVVGCYYFPPGLQLPLQPLRGLLPVLLLGEQRHSGCEQFA